MYSKTNSSLTLGDVKKLLPDYFIKIRRNTIINAQKIKSPRSKERKIVLYDGNTFQYAIQNSKIIIIIRIEYHPR